MAYKNLDKQKEYHRLYREKNREILRKKAIFYNNKRKEKNKKLKETETEEIIRLYNNHLNSIEISKILNLSTATIRRRIKKRLGLKRLRSYIRTEKHKKAMSVKLKGKFKGKHFSSETEFKKGNSSWNSGKKYILRKDVLENTNEVISLYVHQNKSMRKIGELFNCEPNLIKKILRNNNIEIKDICFFNSGERNYFYGKHLIGEKNSMFGKHQTQEARTKIAKANSKPKSKEHVNRVIESRKNNGWFKNLEETRKNMSKTRKNKIASGEIKIKSGKEHPLWNSGSSFEPYGLEFNKKLREQIRERDNDACQECGKTLKELKRGLGVHHIDYNKKNNSIFNLITLCNNCHSKTNFNRKHWENYFKMKMFIKEFFNPQNILIFNENKQLIGMERIR